MRAAVAAHPAAVNPSVAERAILPGVIIGTGGELRMGGMNAPGITFELLPA